MSDEEVERRDLTVGDLEAIIDLLESGLQEEAESRLKDLCKELRDDDLAAQNDKVFEQVGSLTRDLHEAIKKFANDDRLITIANVDMPKASERLSSIIQMTDAAASKTLDAVDACEPMIKSLNESIEKLLPAWNRLMHGRIDRDNFVTLCRNVDALIHDTEDRAGKLGEQLNVILMAQDYQDLTGQMIQKVIHLVSEVEEKMVNFLTHFSEEDKKKITNSTTSGIVPEGPVVGEDLTSDKVAASQDDVDDLLASLGF